MQSPGWVKVTIESEAVTQNKRVDATLCTTMEELKEAIWEECGHLLRGVKQKEAVLLCQPSSSNSARFGSLPWLCLTSASDVQQAIECGIFKLAERRLCDSELAVAFVMGSSASKKTKGAKRATNGSDSSSDGEDMPLLV